MEDAILSIKIKQITEALGRGERASLQVLGLSMWPMLLNGQTVEIKNIPFENIMIGDIILTYADDCTLCHRVFRKGRGFVQTKGDAMIGWDAPVTAADIIGKVVIKYKGDKAVNLEGANQRIFAFLYVYLTLVISPLYPLLGMFRRGLRHMMSKWD